MGFEPTATRATIWCSNQLSYTHRMAGKKDKLIKKKSRIIIFFCVYFIFFSLGAPGGTRTPSPQLRRLLLYPLELLARKHWRTEVMDYWESNTPVLQFSICVLSGQQDLNPAGVPAASWSQTRRCPSGCASRTALCPESIYILKQFLRFRMKSQKITNQIFLLHSALWSFKKYFTLSSCRRRSYCLKINELYWQSKFCRFYFSRSMLF